MSNLDHSSHNAAPPKAAGVVMMNAGHSKGLPCPNKLKPQTPEQIIAHSAYKSARSQELRFLDSPFVNPHGEHKYRQATQAALQQCQLAGLVQ